MILVLESMQLATSELVTDKAVACWWHTLLPALLCDFTINLLLIRVSVGLSGRFAVVGNLICAVWLSQLHHVLSNLFVSLSHYCIFSAVDKLTTGELKFATHCLNYWLSVTDLFARASCFPVYSCWRKQQTRRFLRVCRCHASK